MGERGAGIALARERGHHRAGCGAGERIERFRPLGSGQRLLRPALPQQLAAPPEQRRDRAGGPVPPLRRQPLFEPRRSRHRESFEKLSRNQLGGPGPLGSGNQRVEGIGIEVHRTRGEADLAGRGIQAFSHTAAAQHPKRFVERMLGRTLRLLRPEQATEMFPGAGQLGRPRQIDQKREVLAPEQLGRRRAFRHDDFNGTEHPAGDHVQSGP